MQINCKVFTLRPVGYFLFPCSIIILSTSSVELFIMCLSHPYKSQAHVMDMNPKYALYCTLGAAFLADWWVNLLLNLLIADGSSSSTLFLLLEAELSGSHGHVRGLL